MPVRHNNVTVQKKNSGNKSSSQTQIEIDWHNLNAVLSVL